MDETRRSQIEAWAHDLLSRPATPTQQREMLQQLCDDAEARQVVEEYLAFHHNCRAVLHLPDDAVALEMPDVSEAIRGVSEALHQHTPVYRIPAVAWSMRIAAVLVIVGSLVLLFIQTQRNGELQRQLAQSGDKRNSPVALDADSLDQLRAVWRMAAEPSDGDTWVLLNNGGGLFGSLADAPSEHEPAAGGFLLLRCQVLNDHGQAVYAADVLVPLRSEVKLDVPDAGHIDGHDAALQFSVNHGRASLGLRMNGEGPGVSGDVLIGGVAEIGQFRYRDQTLRAVVQTRQFSEL